MNAELSSIRDTVIHFETNSTRIPLNELPVVDALGEQLRRLSEDAKAKGEVIRIEVVGHSDHTGAEEHNSELSQERASTVIRMLEESGVEGRLLSGTGVGDNQPERIGEDLYEQNLDRRVTLRVRVVPRV